MTTVNKRVYILDVLRGISVIAMIIHHSYVLLHFVKGTTFNFFHSGLFDVLQLIFVSIFLLISGICTNYSKNVVKRGSVVFAAAVVVTAVTAVLLPAFGVNGLEIYFGILHMFGISMLLYAVLRPLLDRCNGTLILILCLMLFSIQLVWMDQMPFFESPYNITMIFGFPSRSFYSADYYPLLPYFFLFVAGAMIGRPVKQGRFPHWFYEFRLPALEFVGRHSLVIYLLHQPIVFALIIGVDWITGLF